MTHHLDIFMSGKNLGLNGLRSLRSLDLAFNSVIQFIVNNFETHLL